MILSILKDTMKRDTSLLYSCGPWKHGTNGKSNNSSNSNINNTSTISTSNSRWRRLGWRCRQAAGRRCTSEPRTWNELCRPRRGSSWTCSPRSETPSVTCKYRRVCCQLIKLRQAIVCSVCKEPRKHFNAI